MKLKNLQRAGELAEDYATLKRARNILSKENVEIRVYSSQSTDGQVLLPVSVKMNVLQAVNLEINKIEKEVNEL